VTRLPRVADDFSRDLLHGARLLRRNPGFTAIVLATLAIAVGASLTVFGIVDAWLFRPLDFPAADRLVVAFGARPERPSEPAVWLPYRAYVQWKERSRSFSSVSAAFMRDVTVTSGSDSRTVLGLSVTSEFFRTLGVQPIRGRMFSDGDITGPNSVVLSYGMWQRDFAGSETVIGTAITLSDTPYEVIGVMPRAFDVRLLDMRYEFWTLLETGRAGYDREGIGPVALIGRLANGVTFQTAQLELAALMKENESRYRENFNSFLVNLTSLQADNTRTVRATLLVVSAAVASLLLIAAMNVGTLLLGRGLGRAREVAIRAALGSDRSRLVRQFLSESSLLAVLGGIGGLSLAIAGMRLFIAWNPLGTLPANSVRFDLRVLLAAVVAMAAITLVSGLVPALRSSAAKPSDALRVGGDRTRSATPAQRAQTAMLVAQMAACVVLLVSTTLLIRTFVRLHNEPLGFDPENLSVAVVSLPIDPVDAERWSIYYQQLAGRLRALRDVRAVAAGTSRPLHTGPPVTVNTRGEDAPDAPRIGAQDVTTDFFETLDIPLVAGRPFDGRDSAGGAPVIILNARAARDLFGSPAEAVGKRVRLNREPWREVVGVVGNVRSTFFNTLEWLTDPILYRPADQTLNTLPHPGATSFDFHLHVRSTRPLAMADLRNIVLSMHSRATVKDLRTVSDLVAEATRQPAIRMRLLFSFAGISLLLAAIGVYGLVSQAATQRVREIAIRIALGADSADLIVVFVRRALMAGIVGLAIGCVVAWMLSNSLQALLYGVRPRDAISFTTAAVALLGVTGVAAFIPAFRATRVDPASVLRAD
jgi:predicted permease